MDIDIRPVDASSWRAANDAIRAALLAGPIGDETFAKGQAAWEGTDGLAAWDRDRCIGHAGAYRLETTVPGGASLPTAGVTRIGILPTHTRRGLLTRMMDRLLSDAREDRGQVLASLRASEATIYSRFGFGVGGDSVTCQIDPRRARPLRGRSAGGSMRLLRHDEVLDVVPALYDRVARQRVGTISRPAWMWRRYLDDASTIADEAMPKGHYVAVHTSTDGIDDGYVQYEINWNDSFDQEAAGEGFVVEAFGADAAVERDLWRYLLSIDLVRQWRADERPSEDWIRRTFADIRAYETRRRNDEQWIRLLDVGAALGARTYGPGAGTVRIAVHDPLFGSNCGTWEVGADGATRVSDSEDRADLVTPIAGISAAYLGGVSWSDLAASGEVNAPGGSPAVALADALFAVHPTPFCGSFF